MADDGTVEMTRDQVVDQMPAPRVVRQIFAKWSCGSRLCRAGVSAQAVAESQSHEWHGPRTSSRMVTTTASNPKHEPLLGGTIL